MSHFTCYVVVKNDDKINPREGEFDIDEINDRVTTQLEPFCEEAEQQYMEFNDLSQDYKDQYKGVPTKNFSNELEVKRINAIVETATGRVLGSIYDQEKPEIARMYKKEKDSLFGESKLVLKEGFEQKKLLPSEIYKTFEEYVRDYHCDEKMGYYRNPNAKWDWYIVGGRWLGRFKPKSNLAGFMGDSTWASGNVASDNVDIIQKKNIDVEGMINDLREERIALWEKHWAKSNIDITNYKTWSEMYSERASELELERLPREEIDLLRIKFSSQEASSAVSKMEKEMGMINSAVDFFCHGDFDKYMEITAFDVLSSYSILKDSKWFESGKMGWFGTKLTEEADFESQWLELFDSIDDDDWIVNIDCHI